MNGPLGGQRRMLDDEHAFPLHHVPRAVVDKRALQFFYRQYRRPCTVADARRGERILGIFRAI